MDQRLKFRRISLVVLLALVPAACSSTGPSRLSIGSLCKASGGTYAAGSCQPASNPQTAAQLCAGLAAEHGYTFTGLDISMAPHPGPDRSIARAIEMLSGAPFGGPGTLAATGGWRPL